MYKYDEKFLISISIKEKKNNLLLLELDDENNLVKTCEIKVNFTFKKNYGFNHYTVRGYNNKTLLTLKDKRIILLCHNKIYILTLGIN